MNQDQILSIVGSVMKIGGTIAGAYGWATDSQWVVYTSVAIALTPLIRDMIVHSPRGKLAAAAAMPEVKGIVVTTPALAAEIPSPKVVATAADIPPTIKAP